MKRIGKYLWVLFVTLVLGGFAANIWYFGSDDAFAHANDIAIFGLFCAAVFVYVAMACYGAYYTASIAIEDIKGYQEHKPFGWHFLKNLCIAVAAISGTYVLGVTIVLAVNEIAPDSAPMVDELFELSLGQIPKLYGWAVVLAVVSAVTAWKMKKQ